MKEPSWKPWKPFQAIVPHTTTAVPMRSSKVKPKPLDVIPQLGPKDKTSLTLLIKELAIAQERELELENALANVKQHQSTLGHDVQLLLQQKQQALDEKQKLELELTHANELIQDFMLQTQALKDKIRHVETSNVACSTSIVFTDILQERQSCDAETSYSFIDLKKSVSILF